MTKNKEMGTIILEIFQRRNNKLYLNVVIEKINIK